MAEQDGGGLLAAPLSGQTPKVSIVIPAYNCAHFLPETLESVFSQNYDAYEIIIVDDGSTDALVNVLQPYTDRVRYRRQGNAGSAAARNTGLDLALGDYIVFLDADDLLLPGKLKEQAAYLDLRPSLGMVHSGWILIDEDGRHLQTIEPWQEAPVLDLKTWFMYKPIRMGAMMYRRAWLESVAGFDTSLRQSHDVDLMLRLTSAGCRAEWMYRPTMAYRFYAGSTIRRNARKQQGYVTRVITKFLAQPNLPPEIREIEDQVRYYNLRWIGWHLYKSGHLTTIASPFEQAFSYAGKPKGSTAVEIADRFLDYLAADGHDPADLKDIFPALKAGGHFQEFQWQQVERFLNWRLNHLAQPTGETTHESGGLWSVWIQTVGQENEIGVPAETIMSWWVEVWRFYMAQARPSSLQVFTQFNQLPLTSLLKICQFCLVLRPGEASLDLIDRLWADLKEAGLVAGEQATAVTALYLTIFGQQVMGRHWSAAAKSLARIVPLSFSGVGWQAWRRFSEATFAYYPLGLRPKPHLLLGALPDYADESLISFVKAGKQAGWQISAVAGGKGRLYAASLAAADWVPAGVLHQLAQNKPADYGRYLRQLRHKRKKFAHYRKLPLFAEVWQAIYFHTPAAAAANRHLFTLGLPVIVRAQGDMAAALAENDLEEMLQQATAVLCDSEANRARLAKQGVPSEKTYLVYPGVDTTFFTPAAQRPAGGELKIVMAADVAWQSGLEAALTAVAYLCHSGTAVQVELLGDGPESERLLYAIHDLDLPTAVCWQKQNSPEARRAAYRAADLFLSGQVQDGLPLPVLEAMACGLPVVTTDLPSLRELITDGKEGRLVKPGNPACLAEVLHQLQQNLELMGQMGAAARQRIESNFTEAHYQRCITGFLKVVN